MPARKSLLLLNSNILSFALTLSAAEDLKATRHPSTLFEDIMAPGTAEGFEGSPLLSSTIRQLTVEDHAIRDLSTKILIGDKETQAIVYGGSYFYAIKANTALDTTNLKAEQPPYIQSLHGSTPEEFRLNYLQSILSVMWFLYSEAINKGQAFTDGSFTIIDTDFKLYKFLLYYARTFNSELKGSIEDPAAKGSSNQFAYSRISSHWQSCQNTWRQYGIDMRFEPNKAAQQSLPAGKTHLLFGIIGEAPTPLLFIKFEDNGLFSGGDAVGGEFLGHAFSYLVSRTKKLESLVPQPLYKNSVGMLVGSDDDPGSCREHVRNEFINQCHTILYSSPLYGKYYPNLSSQGVRQLVAYIKQKPADWDQKLCHEFATYFVQLSLKYDYLEYRKGSEVILSQAELQPSSLYFHRLHTAGKQEAIERAFLTYELLKKRREVQQQITCFTDVLQFDPPSKFDQIRDAQEKKQDLSRRLTLLKQATADALTRPLIEQAPQ
jgi:hypothetical protein